MNRLLAMLAVCAMTALEGVALELQDVPDQAIVYTIDDPFAIGVSTASYTICTNLQSRMTIVEAAVAYAYSPTNPPPSLGVDVVARAAAAYAYSPTNKPPALTNYLFAAVFTNGAWWAVIINP